MVSLIKKIFGRSHSGSKKFKYVEDDTVSELPRVLSASFYLAVIIIIGLPVWYLTCSITRYSLPNIKELEGSLLTDQPRLHLDISVIKLSGHESPKSDNQINYLRKHLPTKLDTYTTNVSYNINWRVRRPTQEETHLFRLHPMEDAFTVERSQEALKKLEHDLVKIHKSVDKFRLFMYIIDESHYPAFCDSRRSHTYTISFERFVYLCPSYALVNNDDQKPIINLVKQVLNDVYVESIDPVRVKQIINSEMDLLISLVPESSELEEIDRLTTSGDRLHHIFAKNVKTKFADLAEIVNVRAITQNFIGVIDGDQIDKMLIKEERKIDAEKMTNVTEQVEFRLISVSELQKLFQKFESKLGGHSSQSVYRVLVIMPDVKKPPLAISQRARTNYNILEGQNSNAMLLVNDDKAMVLGMRAITRRLIGLSSVDLCKNCLVRRDVFFNKWELDSIMGSLTSQKLQSIYISLKSISDQNNGLRILKNVSKMTQEAYTLTLDAIDHLKKKRTLEAYRVASQAYQLSEAAFYDPTLLDHPNFPDELKYAIYLPLFFPLAIPFLNAFTTIIKFILSKLSRAQIDKPKFD